MTDDVIEYTSIKRLLRVVRPEHLTSFPCNVTVKISERTIVYFTV